MFVFGVVRLVIDISVVRVVRVVVVVFLLLFFVVIL